MRIEKEMRANDLERLGAREQREIDQSETSRDREIESRFECRERDGEREKTTEMEREGCSREEGTLP